MMVGRPFCCRNLIALAADENLGLEPLPDALVQHVERIALLMSRRGCIPRHFIQASPDVLIVLKQGRRSHCILTALVAVHGEVYKVLTMS